MGVWLGDSYPFAGLVLFFLCPCFYIFCHHLENFVLPVMSLLYIGCLLIRIFLAFETSCLGNMDCLLSGGLMESRLGSPELPSSESESPKFTRNSPISACQFFDALQKSSWKYTNIHKCKKKQSNWLATNYIKSPFILLLA